jgi:molecular chaperone HtpG
MIREIEIPQHFKEVLDRSYSLTGFLLSSISEFGIWLGENNVKFFTEYTDHSLKHVEDILRTTYKLIRDECKAIITPEDIATLILAILLHDSAMHLSKDGFVTLIQPDSENKPIPGFKDKSWSLLWQDYIAEARRFSGRKLIAIFGDAEPIHVPTLESNQLTERDLLLIGEFLRRHHHRLAHEIALYGVPGPGKNRLKLEIKEETKHIIDLAGLIARSHGLPLRSCFDYLLSTYSSLKVQRGVHTPFLMALLRLSDVLQIQAERAPYQILKIRTLRSPISQGEWEMHQAIKDINMHEYPETILIHAEPLNVKTYLRIKELLSRVQRELDESWTVIGEIYAYDRSFREFGFTIRRVRSNLDDEKAFAKKVNYIPCYAAFEVADTDLLKLLVSPLYGDSPQIGIRELLQNSIDAVRELREYRRMQTNQKETNPISQEVDIVIDIDKEDGNWWVTVSDSGIGMTLDTICQYLLKAGASLRRSEIWRKTFEDQSGKSRVLRSGRFGVGMLASFLLGDKIQVSTRHISAQANNGIEFSAEIDTEAIELRQIERSVGTTIRVRINKEVKKKLLGEWNKAEKKWESTGAWDWYCLADPKVIRFAYPNRRKLPQKYKLPLLDSELPTGWHRIVHSGFRDIHWTYKDAPHLTCNGIKVMDWSFKDLYEGNSISIRTPKISVFDFDSRLPLNLQRTDLTTEYPFKKELLDDVSKDFISFVLVNAPPKSLLNAPDSSTVRWYIGHKYPGIEERFGTSEGETLIQLSSWFSTNTGISLADDPWHLDKIDNKHALYIFYVQNIKYGYDYDYDYYMNKRSIIPKIDQKLSHAIFTSKNDIRIEANRSIRLARMFIDTINFALGHELSYHYRTRFDYRALTDFLTSGKRALINRSILKHIEDHEDYLPRESRSDEFMDWAKEEWKNKDWVLWKVGECPQPKFDFVQFAEKNANKDDRKWIGIIAEWYLKDSKPKFEPSPIACVWEEVVGSPIIPFDLQERRHKLAKTYKELKAYIKAHEALKQKSD